MEKPKTWVINLEGLLSRAKPFPGGKEGQTAINFPQDIPGEDLAKIANYKPIIVAAPGEVAQAIAKAFSLVFKNAPVGVSYFLQCSYSDVALHATKIWESVEVKNKEDYKIRIFIPEP